jgi:hypothetical protein
MTLVVARLQSVKGAFIVKIVQGCLTKWFKVNLLFKFGNEDDCWMWSDSLWHSYGIRESIFCLQLYSYSVIKSGYEGQRMVERYS